jgi:hypothetical protein
MRRDAHERHRASDRGQAENPFVVRQRSLPLFTDWRTADSVSVSNPRDHGTRRRLVRNKTNGADWFYRGYMPDTGVNAIEVVELGHHPRYLMSQSISSDVAGYPRTERRTLLLRCATWGADGSVETSNWGPASSQNLLTGVGLESGD